MRPLINAAGILTGLGGSLMPQEVMRAMGEASRYYVRLRDLQRAAGERIAALVGVESALITSGAAAALLQGTAACITRSDTERMGRLPDTTGMPNEVIVQRAHHHGFEQAIRAAGARLVEIDTRAELEHAIGPQTAMMHSLVYGEPKGQIKAAEWVAVAREHGIPTLMDAAAELPPVGNLKLFWEMGFDLVAFSGGKGLRGPQCSGLLLGRKDLIAAAAMNGSRIARGCKVGKEEVIGLLTAVELYLKRDHAADFRRWDRVVSDWESAFRSVRYLSLARSAPEAAGKVPYLAITWDEAAVGFTRRQFQQRLRDGEPSIELWSETDIGLYITPFTLNRGEEKIVSRGILNTLRSLESSL
jgi:L-seryl-tRNA(Ser) seleniumtransferase